MDNNLFGAAISFILGIGISFANYRLTDMFLKKVPDKFSVVFVLRQALGVLYIVALYFLAPYTPWDRLYLLVGAALGITIPMFIFTAKLLSGTDNTKNMKEKEEDNNG